uniref:Uncharacterized protein n=1 Tax=Romanomermis culicivorax TaxID=13658 RepID=A0A915JTC0_ROMCU
MKIIEIDFLISGKAAFAETPNAAFRNQYGIFFRGVMAGVTHSCLKKNRSIEEVDDEKDENDSAGKKKKNNNRRCHRNLMENSDKNQLRRSKNDGEIQEILSDDEFEANDDNQDLMIEDLYADEKDECLREISEILPEFLYMSGMDVLKNFRKLDDLQITAALNCIKGASNKKLAKRFAPTSSYLHVPIEDEDREKIDKHFDRVINFLSDQKSQNRRVVVYCGLGVSRSAAFVLAYLMADQRMTLFDAYKFLRSKRSVILPNVGFFKQLIDLEKRLFDGRKTVDIIRPLESNKIEVPDVVWAEVYEEVSKKLSRGCR